MKEYNGDIAAFTTNNPHGDLFGYLTGDNHVRSYIGYQGFVVDFVNALPNGHVMATMHVVDVDGSLFEYNEVLVMPSDRMLSLVLDGTLSFSTDEFRRIRS